MELYERIEAMCRQHGVTITEMCRDAGISRASVSDLKHGRSRFLSSATIHKMSSYFRNCVMKFANIGYEDSKRYTNFTFANVFLFILLN